MATEVKVAAAVAVVTGKGAIMEVKVVLVALGLAVIMEVKLPLVQVVDMVMVEEDKFKLMLQQLEMHMEVRQRPLERNMVVIPKGIVEEVEEAMVGIVGAVRVETMVETTREVEVETMVGTTGEVEEATMVGTIGEVEEVNMVVVIHRGTAEEAEDKEVMIAMDRKKGITEEMVASMVVAQRQPKSSSAMRIVMRRVTMQESTSQGFLLIQQ